VVPVRNDVSDERIDSIIRVIKIGELGSTLAVFLRSMLRLIITANIVPNSQILPTLIMEEICCYETSVLTRTTRRNIPEDGILHSHCPENLKSYISKKLVVLSLIRNLRDASDLDQAHATETNDGV
jgi:hypothetical protein